MCTSLNCKIQQWIRALFSEGNAAGKVQLKGECDQSSSKINPNHHGTETPKIWKYTKSVDAYQYFDILRKETGILAKYLSINFTRPKTDSFPLRFWDVFESKMHEISICLPNISCDEQNFLRESTIEPPNLKIPLQKFYKSMRQAMVVNVRFGGFWQKSI